MIRESARITLSNTYSGGVIMVEINSDIWLNVKDLPHEIWKDIENFENLYKISNYG